MRNRSKPKVKKQDISLLDEKPMVNYVRMKNDELNKLLRIVHVHCSSCSQLKKDIRDAGGSKLLRDYAASLKGNNVRTLKDYF